VGEDGHVVVVEEAKFTKVGSNESALGRYTCRTGLQLDQTVEISVKSVDFAFANDFRQVRIEGTSTAARTARTKSENEGICWLFKDGRRTFIWPGICRQLCPMRYANGKIGYGRIARLFYRRTLIMSLDLRK